MEHGLGPDHWRGKGELSSTDGRITLVVDYGDEDYYIDARPGYSATAMRSILAQARVRGLEPMDEYECEPEILEDGTVRLYLALAAKSEPEPVIVPAPARKRKAFAFAIAAALIVGILIPTPLRYFFDDMPTFDRKTTQSVPMDRSGPVGIQNVSEREDH